MRRFFTDFRVALEGIDKPASEPKAKTRVSGARRFDVHALLRPSPGSSPSAQTPACSVLFSIIAAASLLCLLPVSASAQSAPKDGRPVIAGILNKVGIDQKLGARVPVDATFTDEEGRPVKLGDVIGHRPAILVLNYFDCPQLCGLVLNDLSRTLKVMPLTAGKDFDVLAVSFDPTDVPAVAKAKRDGYVRDYERVSGKTGTAGGWHFLTGRQPEIDRLCEAVGFRYAWDASKQQYAHAAGVMVLTPDGRVARYFYGIEYRPTDLRLAIDEAAGGKLSSPVEQVLLYCFAYDPSTGRYSLAIWNTVKIGAALTALGLVALVGTLLWRERRQKQRAAAESREEVSA